MRKVLVTGAFGFLGEYLIKYLNNQFKISTLDNKDRATIISDITKPIPFLVDKFDLVIHVAGKAHSIPKTEGEKKSFYNVNLQGTINLCKALDNNLPDTFVFISTIAVYGRDEGKNIMESDPLIGNTPYAKSKIMAEEYLQEWSKEKDVNLVILRLPLVAGRNPKGNLGSMLNGIKKGYYFNISGSNAKKSVVLADDIARLIPNLIGKRGIYNLAGDKDYTFEEISKIIANQSGNQKVYSLPYAFVSILAKIGDVIPKFPIDSLKLKKIMSDLTVSSEKAINELNWMPKPLSDNFKIK